MISNKLYQYCPQHPSQIFYNINISPNCNGSRIKCAQCIHDQKNETYKNSDYVLFQTVEQKPLDFLVRTTQSQNLIDFLQYKQKIQRSAFEQICNLEKGFNQFIKEFRSKIVFCKHNLCKIKQKSEETLKQIMQECEINTIVINIEDLIYLEDQELDQKIQTINQLTTQLISNDQLKSQISDKVQDFFDGNKQKMEEQMFEIQSIKELTHEFQIKTQKICQDLIQLDFLKKRGNRENNFKFKNDQSKDEEKQQVQQDSNSNEGDFHSLNQQNPIIQNLQNFNQIANSPEITQQNIRDLK